MRICIISAFEDTLLNDTGFSVRIYNLAKSLAALGNTVEILLPKFRESIVQIDGCTAYFLKGFFPERLLKQIGRLLGVMRPTALFVYDPLFVYKACKIIQKCDVVQFEQQSAGALLIPIVAKLIKKPIIIDCHNIFQALKIKEANFVRKIIETSIEKMIYKFANLILTVSDKERKVLLSYQITKADIAIIPNGVETRIFAPEKKFESCDYHGLLNKRVVVFVGNMEYAPNKEAVNLIATKIAPEVIKKVKETIFLLVGRISGPTYHNLHYLGVVKNVAPILAASDVAIAPLLNGAGTRLKILEYFSCGLPVVSTTVGAEGLEVKNGVHIIIEDDMDLFALKIVALLENPKLSKHIGQSARQLVLDKYDWTKIGAYLNEVIKKTLIRNQ
ncbi:MAG: glycosyltransferase family 4 protein [Candidatus Bathyarchaeia archaeon]